MMEIIDALLINAVLVVAYLTGILIINTTKYEIEQSKKLMPLIKRLFIIFLAFIILINISTIALALSGTLIVLILLILTRSQLMPTIITLLLLILSQLNIKAQTPTTIILFILVIMLIGSQDYIKSKQKTNKLLSMASVKILTIFATTLLVLI